MQQASSIAGKVDALYLFLVGTTVFFTLLICVLILAFGIYFRRGSKADRANPPTSILLEIGWSIIPFVFAMIMFAWGAVLFYEIQTPPENTLEIEVVGKQWMWKTQHPNGRSEINALHVPAGQPVRLRMISEDVIHSFYIPAFRVKQDVLPGYYSQLWFTPTKVGSYHLFCAEYCGTEHSGMIGTVTVMEPTEYARWQSGESGDPPAQVGERLFERFRCATCHKAQGGGTGPSLVGVFGKQVPLEGGGAVVADEQYLRDSILNPQKDIVAGFPRNMPSFQGQISESEVFSLIAYLKSLGTPPSQQDSPESGNGEENE